MYNFYVCVCVQVCAQINIYYSGHKYLSYMDH